MSGLSQRTRDFSLTDDLLSSQLYSTTSRTRLFVRLVVGHYLWVLKVSFFIACLIALVECLVRSYLVDIRCSAHHLLSIVVGVCLVVGGSRSFRLTPTFVRSRCHNQIDGKLSEVSNASSHETGWKDRRIKSPLCARVGWVAYLAGVFFWSGLSLFFFAGGL